MGKLKKILVIDDDDEYNFLTEDIFSEMEFDCELSFKLKAEEGLAYLETCKEFPDLILLDINMPIMNGWDFLEEYQRKKYHEKYPTLIIMTSSSVYREDEIKAKSYPNVIEYIEKPLTPEGIDAIYKQYFGQDQ